MFTLSELKNVKIESRNQKYFDRYTFAVKFYLPHISSLRKLDPVQIDEALQYRQERNKNYAGSWRYVSGSLPITETIIKNCHSFANYLLAKKTPYKFVIFDSHIGHFYSDVESEVQQLTQLHYIKILQTKKAIVDIPNDCILRKKSEYKHRMYIANQKLDIASKKNLQQFLMSRNDIKISPLFDEWIVNNFSHLYDSLFIDYNDAGFPMLLQLVAPVKIKKSLKIINDKY